MLRNVLLRFGQFFLGHFRVDHTSLTAHLCTKQNVMRYGTTFAFIVAMKGARLCCPIYWLMRGVDPGGCGIYPWKYVGGSQYVLTHKNVTFFHSKLLLDNSASFTSSGMKDLCQKWKVKLIFRGANRPSGTGIVGCSEIMHVGCNPKQSDGLTWLTLTPIFHDRSTSLGRCSWAPEDRKNHWTRVRA